MPWWQNVKCVNCMEGLVCVFSKKKKQRSKTLQAFQTKISWLQKSKAMSHHIASHYRTISLYELVLVERSVQKNEHCKSILCQNHTHTQTRKIPIKSQIQFVIFIISIRVDSIWFGVFISYLFFSLSLLFSWHILWTRLSTYTNIEHFHFLALRWYPISNEKFIRFDGG